MTCFILCFYSFMLYALFTFSIYISCHFHLCSFEHLFSCHFYFAHLSFSFPFLRYLIININPKKSLMVLGLFGYYPWHYGAWDYFLDLGLETLAYLGDLVILSDYFVWSSWGLPQDIGLLVCFCVQFFVITSFVCNMEFTRIQPLLCPIFVKT